MVRKDEIASSASSKGEDEEKESEREGYEKKMHREENNFNYGWEKKAAVADGNLARLDNPMEVKASLSMVAYRVYQQNPTTVLTESAVGGWVPSLTLSSPDSVSALENDLPDLTSFSLSSFRGIVDNQSPNEKNFAKMSSDLWMNKSLRAVISSY
ncbi:hypothetical protein NPIL_214001 [Nephila pilipes]|uniref:Uncharacterized protein n=1 Tax=Nephila pilipes TaxID=299642 RepID=A0A8X6P6R2_NEPPI|nr:hypothetical protein NPIL_214001 [Nephila pilipes]